MCVWWRRNRNCPKHSFTKIWSLSRFKFSPWNSRVFRRRPPPFCPVLRPAVRTWLLGAELDFPEISPEERARLLALPYSKRLEHPFWQQKRLEVIAKAMNLCEDCRKIPYRFEIHHTAYDGGLPWEYHFTHLMALCPSCHLKRQPFEDSLRMVLGEITRTMAPAEVEAFFWEVREQAAKRVTNWAVGFNPGETP